MTPPDETVRAGEGSAGSPAPDPLRMGDVLADRYEVRSLLGAGGMGAVYEVQDRELGVTVALKTLAPRLLADERALRQLKREVLLARQVSHENVCRLHDLGRDPNRQLLFCTMELLSGETLDQHLDRVGPMSPAEARPIVSQMLAGLDAAHRAGVLHRDFKGGNVLLVPGEGAGGLRVALTDFGIASRRERGPGEGPAEAEIQGTLAYMAPEQLRGRSAGPATDIYALGVVLFEMVTGRLPFAFDGTVASALRKLDGPAPSAAEYAPGLPKDWELAIRRCLARDPEKRFQRIAEVREALAAETAEPPPEEVPGNLPGERDAFFGRQADLEAIGAAFSTESRLITLLGPGGSGKTRLAQRSAHEFGADFPGGAWFCDLTEATTEDGVLAAVSNALEVPLGPKDPVEQLGHALHAHGRCLVVLDNAERAAGAIRPLLADWMGRADEAVLLVTSRQRLRLAEETVRSVGPLEQDDAVALFVERARRHRSQFQPGEADMAHIEELVRKLDRLPLAIELAAARVRMMTPRQIAERISERFRLLVGGSAAPRHGTLRAALDGSWEMLEDWERAAFAQSAVFDGGFTLEAAEEVLDLGPWPEAPWTVDVLQGLLDKSVLHVATSASGGEQRFGMLTSLQEYASEKLGVGGRQQAEERHGAYFERRAGREAAAPGVARSMDERRRWLTDEFDNLNAACRIAVARGQGDRARAVFCALEEVYVLRGPFGAALALGKEVLDTPGEDASVSARALRAVAHLQHLAGRMDESLGLYRSALTASREIGDRSVEGRVLGDLGRLHHEQGRMDEAARFYAQSLQSARTEGNRFQEGLVLGNIGILHDMQGRVAQAREHYELALAIHREVGNRRMEGTVLGNLANLLRSTEASEESLRFYETALAIHREVGNRSEEATVLGNLGIAARMQGRMREALRHQERALMLQRQIGYRDLEANAQANLGIAKLELGRLLEAEDHFMQSMAIACETGNRLLEGVLATCLGLVSHQRGEMDGTRRRFTDALSIHREVGNREWEGMTEAFFGNLHRDAGEPVEAERCYERALSIHRDTEDRCSEGAVRGFLGDLLRRQGDLQRSRQAFDSGESLLRDSKDMLELGRLLSARGLLDVQTGRLAAARAALEEAGSIAGTLGVEVQSQLGAAVSALRAALSTTEGKEDAHR